MIRATLSTALTAVLLCPAHAWKLEAANFTTPSTFGGGTFVTVNFRQTYLTPPVVVALGSNQGGNPADLRIRNVTTTGFDVAPVEPASNDGPHIAMDNYYIAMEPGQFALPDGTLIEAGRVDVSASVSGVGAPGALQSASFVTTFANPPAVLADLQTMNNETGSPPAAPSIPFLTPAVANVSNTGMSLGLERSEIPNGSVTTSESMGYIAIAAGAAGTLLDNAGAGVRFESIRTGNVIRGWSDTCVTTNYATPFGSAPVVVATKNTRNETDGGWFRRCAFNAGGIGVEVDEDQATDSERTHVGERAGILAFARNFDADLQPDLVVVKQSTVLSDPFNTISNPKRIPGALIEYRVLVTNQGDGAADPRSVVLTDRFQRKRVSSPATSPPPAAARSRLLMAPRAADWLYCLVGLAAPPMICSFPTTAPAASPTRPTLTHSETTRSPTFV